MDTIAEIFGYIIIIAVVIVVVALLSAVPVWLLWNWTIPDVFGLPEITFWQAVRLSILTGLLFKSYNSSKNSS